MSLVYVVGRDGKYVGFFPPGTSADRIVARYGSRVCPAADLKSRPGCFQSGNARVFQPSNTVANLGLGWRGTLAQ